MTSLVVARLTYYVEEIALVETSKLRNFNGSAPRTVRSLLRTVGANLDSVRKLYPKVIVLVRADVSDSLVDRL